MILYRGDPFIVGDASKGENGQIASYHGQCQYLDACGAAKD